MSRENLPQKLYDRHAAELGLGNPAVFETEESFLAEYANRPESALVFLPKSKALVDMVLALVSGKVAEGGTVVLVGSNAAGIRSAKDAFEANIGAVDQKIVGNHSAMYVGKNLCLGAKKKLEDFLSFFPVSYSGPAGTAHIETANMPGVFSAGELDAGTKFLLDHIPYRAVRALDVGCGAGVIGSIYKKLAPNSIVTMCDSSRLAVFAAQKTVERNGLAAEVVTSDVFSGTIGQFDLIISNPPFHQGIGTDYSFMEKFARDAAKHLSPKGEAWIVANSFLSYEPLLEKGIGPTAVIADNKKFKVIRSGKTS